MSKGTYELVSLDQLKPYERNARTHGEDQIERLMESIKQFGFLAPILVDDAGVIIAGHGRFEAAQRLKLERVPVVRFAHLTDAQRRAYTIADNRIAEDSNWDWSLVSKEVFELSTEDFDLNLLGFDDKEFQLLQSIDDQTQGRQRQTAPPGSGQSEFKIVIQCESEQEQRALLETLLAQNINCKALM